MKWCLWLKSIHRLVHKPDLKSSWLTTCVKGNLTDTYNLSRLRNRLISLSTEVCLSGGCRSAQDLLRCYDWQRDRALPTRLTWLFPTIIPNIWQRYPFKPSLYPSVTEPSWLSNGQTYNVCLLCVIRPQLATRLLAHKIQSPQEWEALQALTVENLSLTSPHRRMTLYGCYVCMFLRSGLIITI